MTTTPLVDNLLNVIKNNITLWMVANNWSAHPEVVEFGLNKFMDEVVGGATATGQHRPMEYKKRFCTQILCEMDAKQLDKTITKIFRSKCASLESLGFPNTCMLDGLVFNLVTIHRKVISREIKPIFDPDPKYMGYESPIETLCKETIIDGRVEYIGEYVGMSSSELIHVVNDVFLLTVASSTDHSLKGKHISYTEPQTGAKL